MSERGVKGVHSVCNLCIVRIWIIALISVFLPLILALARYWWGLESSPPTLPLEGGCFLIPTSSAGPALSHQSQPLPIRSARGNFGPPSG